MKGTTTKTRKGTRRKRSAQMRRNWTGRGPRVTGETPFPQRPGQRWRALPGSGRGSAGTPGQTLGLQKTWARASAGQWPDPAPLQRWARGGPPAGGCVATPVRGTSKELKRTRKAGWEL